MKKFILIIGLVGIFNSGNAQDSFDSLEEKAQKEINNGNYEKALQLFDNAFEVGSTDSSKVIWAATISSMCASELHIDKKAIRYNNIAIEYGSTEQSLIDQQLNLAKKYKDFETTEKVLLRMKKVPELKEKYTIKLLYFYYNNQKFPETIDAANEVLTNNPRNLNARYFKSIALLKTSEEDAALLILENILAEQPEHKKANTQLGLHYYNKASEIFDAANKSYKSIKEPTRLDYHTYREEIQKAELDYKKSLPYLEKSYSLAAEDYVNKAISLTKNRLRQLEAEK